jgi:small-conductance mechanosensitive channel
MTGLIAFQYWTILFFMVGLCCTRKVISRYALGAITFAISRYFIRYVVFFLEGSGGDHSVSQTIGSDFVSVVINTLVIAVLLSETATGTKCWRLWKIEKRKRRRGQQQITEEVIE